MKTFRVTGIDGRSVILRSDDTFTLAFGAKMEESTPQTLRERISARSMRMLEKKLGDHSSERAKLREALGLDA